MRITAPVTDYIRESILSTQGDLAVRGAALVERLAAGIAGTYLQGKGAATLPAYEKTMPPLTTIGDILTQGAVLPERVGYSTDGMVLRTKGSGFVPVWTSLFDKIVAVGDMWVWNPGVVGRLAAGAMGKVLTAHGAGVLPAYDSLFDLLTTQGDLWVRGATDPQRIAAGALDTYFKGQGAGNLPIYEKLALRDTGVKIGDGTRSTAGDQVITGVGFKPSVVFFFARDDNGTDINMSWGVDDGTTSYMMRIQQDGTLQASVSGASLYVLKDVSNSIRGSISALGGDGFTITWILTGTCGCAFFYLCLP